MPRRARPTKTERRVTNKGNWTPEQTAILREMNADGKDDLDVSKTLGPGKGQYVCAAKRRDLGLKANTYREQKKAPRCPKCTILIDALAREMQLEQVCPMTDCPFVGVHIALKKETTL